MTSPAPPAGQWRKPESASSGAGRFLPGTVLAGRYRMVGLLGRGGMGEVYRADDLKLGQPVALKFLPRDVERDPERLERFLTEVRMSLKVTHPNVCRVFDIAQAEGRHFLSMEYVDGEDLASLLRRIGRLPEDKAVEIARQLCAGLQEAHDEGVLHRDLKPANVMLDGRGRAKITDFGLASATEGIAGAEARAGTPQYMAPEQLAGGTLTKQTDIYALGLVLYELFTGKRAFETRNLNDPASLQSSAPTSPSAHVSGLDPVIERVILRCTDPDPARRPASAAALADALPGGDPLAMAIAAGETPSPEMVARAGGVGVLRPLVAASCLVAILAGLAGVWFLSARFSLFRYVPVELSPAELRVAARSTLANLGYPTPPVDVAFGFSTNARQITAIEEKSQSSDRWNELATLDPAPVFFWYRESPIPLVPLNSVGRTGSFDPPMNRAGMLYLQSDPSGDLLLFRANPPSLDEQEAGTEPDWNKAFSEAGLDVASFGPTEPRWTPPGPSDTRRAWVKGEVRVEAAAYRGRLVWFEVIAASKFSDTGEPAPRAAGQLAGQAGYFVLVVGLTLFAAFVARRNVRLGRSDARGAWRLAILFLVAGTASDLLRTSSSAAAFLGVWNVNLALQLLPAAWIWIGYLAIEPYVRRLWPHTLVTWSRLLEGRFLDPQVGRDLLFGGVAGMLASAIFTLPSAAAWFGLPAPAPVGHGIEALGGGAFWVAAHVNVVTSPFVVPVVVLLLLLIARLIFRKPWLAYVVLVSVFGLFGVFAGSEGPVVAAGLPLIVILSIFVLTRLGLFAMMVTIAFSSWNLFPLITDPASWYFPYSAITMALFAAVAVYGFVVALGNRLTFKDWVLD